MWGKLLILLSVLSLALSAQADDGVKLPGKTDKCPVCGMFVAPYPGWTATIQFKDGSQLFFDGAKDLYRYYLSLPNARDKREHSDIAEIYLTDYYSARLMPIGELLLVIGSDVYGPMGHEFVPIAGAEAASTFAIDHQGKRVLRFEQLTPALIPAD